MLAKRIEESNGSMPWGIFDFRDSTWLMTEPGNRGWTRRPSKATPFATYSAARAGLDQFASSTYTPAIKPRLLPAGDTQHR